MFSKIYRQIMINTLASFILSVESEANDYRAERLEFENRKTAPSVASYYADAIENGTAKGGDLYWALDWLATQDRQASEDYAGTGLTEEGKANRVSQFDQIIAAVIRQLDAGLSYSIHYGYEATYGPTIGGFDCDDPHDFSCRWYGSTDGYQAFKVFNRARRAYNRKEEQAREERASALAA